MYIYVYVYWRAINAGQVMKNEKFVTATTLPQRGAAGSQVGMCMCVTYPYIHDIWLPSF